MTRSSASKVRLDQSNDNVPDDPEDPYTESPDETASQADQSPASESPADNSNDDPWLPDDAYALDLEERRCQWALLLYLQGLTQNEIARCARKSDRTIRRWLTKAKEKGVGRVDNLNPSEELSHILTMLDEYRKEALELKDWAEGMGNQGLKLRCLDKLTSMEERHLRMLIKVGLFENFEPRGAPTVYDLIFGRQLGTEREDHDQERYDYEEGDDIEEDDDDQEEA